MFVKIYLHKSFEKQYKRLDSKQKESFKARRDIFIVNPFDQILNNHPLHGDLKDFRSINVNSDLRVIYKENPKGIYTFYKIDSHSNLYS